MMKLGKTIKKQGIKKLSILAMAFVGLLTLSACSPKKEDFSMTLADYEKRGYITMGLDDTFAPMGFRDSAGELVGFDIDLAKEVLKEPISKLDSSQ